MLGFSIFYMLMWIIVFTVAAYIEFKAFKSPHALVRVDALRILRPILNLFLLFYICILMSIIAETTEIITQGFVNTTSIIISIAAIAYIIDTILTQCKMKDYIFVKLSSKPEFVDKQIEGKCLLKSNEYCYLHKSVNYLRLDVPKTTLSDKQRNNAIMKNAVFFAALLAAMVLCIVVLTIDFSEILG